MQPIMNLGNKKKHFWTNKNHDTEALFNKIESLIKSFSSSHPPTPNPNLSTYSAGSRKQVDKKAFSVRMSDNSWLTVIGDNILPSMVMEAHDRDEANNVFQRKAAKA